MRLRETLESKAREKSPFMGLEEAKDKVAKTRSHGGDKSRVRTLLWNQIEPWQQDNPFIIRGYRAATNSYVRCLQSLGYLHNQSVNIWSHLGGAVCYVVVAWLLCSTHMNRLVEAPLFDLLILGQFYASIIICLVFSSAFHTFGNHSDVINDSFLLYDLVGIILLTMTSFYPGVYYGFFCEPQIARLYWSMITLFGASSLVFILAPPLRTKTWKAYRTIVLICMGLSGVLPMTHAALRFGIPQARAQMGWDWFVLEGISYVSGAAIYATKVPERWRPGFFDIWGSSHQIFHVCVLLGAACHLTGTVHAFIYNHDPATRRC